MLHFPPLVIALLLLMMKAYIDKNLHIPSAFGGMLSELHLNLLYSGPLEP